ALGCYVPESCAAVWGFSGGVDAIAGGLRFEEVGAEQEGHGTHRADRSHQRGRRDSGVNRRHLAGSPMASLNNIITRDPELLGGTPVFRGTRVPFQALLDYIEGGQTLDEFLDDFPTVTREAAVNALEHA